MSERLDLESTTINDAQISYAQQGSGRPLIFVHGGLADFRTWMPQVNTFSEWYHAITYSRRAHYPNEWPDSYTEAAMMPHVEDLHALIKHLGVGPAYIVGNSYGSYISLWLALRYPESVQAMALAEPPVHPLLLTLPEGEALISSFMEEAWQPAGEAFGRGEMEEGVRLFIGGAVGPGEWEHFPQRARDGMMLDARELAVATHTPFSTHMPALTCADLARIEAPTLLLRGENSPPMYTLINNELARCMPHATQAMVHNAAHVLHNQNPDEHDRIVMEWLAEH